MPKAWLPTADHVETATSGKSLVARLRDNERVLLDAYRSIAKAAGEGRAITPAAEWLLDNYHLVEEQIREIRADLPPGYYRQLPKLADGPFAGYPRVFGIAWAFVAHTDSRFDPEMLRRFVRAYQEVQPLTIGELWAVAITLRIVLVENLRRSAEQIIARQRGARRRPTRSPTGCSASDGARRRSGDALCAAIAQRRRCPTRFAVQLVQRLRDQDPEDHAGARLARRAAGRAGHDGRRGRARRAPAAGRHRTSRCATSSPACG